MDAKELLDFIEPMHDEWFKENKEKQFAGMAFLALPDGGVAPLLFSWASAEEREAKILALRATIEKFGVTAYATATEIWQHQEDCAKTKGMGHGECDCEPGEALLTVAVDRDGHVCGVRRDLVRDAEGRIDRAPPSEVQPSFEHVGGDLVNMFPRDGTAH